VAVGILTLTCASEAAATTYQVGPGRQYQRFKQLPLLAPGDIVEISSGTYNEAVRWTDSGTQSAPIIIRGVGTSKPVIDGTNVGVSGVLPEPRALFQIEGDYVVVENIEFRNAHNSAGNGGGIRVIGGRSVVIRNVRITACDTGMQANDHDDLLVEYSEIASNGLPGVYAHNVYIAEGGTTTFRFNYIHDAVTGQNFKTRSHYTELLYNFIADSADGEVGIVDSTSTEQPNSNAVMLGNIVVSKVRGPANNEVKFIDFGQDVGMQHRGVLYLVHNTLVAGAPTIRFLSATSPQASIVAEHNIFVGSNIIVGMPGGGVSGARNWLPTTAVVPPTWVESVRGTSPGFIDPVAGNYRLMGSSSAVDRASGPTPYLDGQGLPHRASPEWEYVSPTEASPRGVVGTRDLGAYEAAGDGPPAASNVR
jgi:parallel beta helix pectate lyase-like protein